MNFTLYAMSVETFVPMLRSLSGILEKGAEHARAKKLDESILVNARLADDMFPLSMQVQIACDNAKDSVARLIGEVPPKFENTEQTIAALKARIEKTIDYLKSADAAALEGAVERNIVIELPVNEMVLEMKGAQFVRDWALPHFYFHIVTAYDILRHNGVQIGKRDYLSHIESYIRRKN